MRPELALALVGLSWAISWGLAALWSAPTLRRPQGQWLYRLLTFAGIALLLLDGWRVLPQTLLWQMEPAWKWAMVGLAALGFCFCWWARLHLGRLWSGSITRKEDHRVVDSGPYALVRHPIYTGLMLAGLAAALLRGTLGFLIGVLVLILACYVKARMEEKFLRAELGADAYDAYAARVPMLVPFLKR